MQSNQFGSGIRFNTADSNYISALDSEKFRASCSSNSNYLMNNDSTCNNNNINSDVPLFPNAEHMDDLTVSQASCLDSATTTPQYTQQIMNWNKQHVTPAESKNLFPAVIAPSIEFSNENSSSLNFALQSINQNSNNNNISASNSCNKGLAMLMSA